MIAWLAKAKVKLYGYLALAGTIVLALVVALGYGFKRGLKVGTVKGDAEAAQTKADVAQSHANAAEQVVQASEVRKEVENEIDQQPDAPPQQVGAADPATAAGKLRDDGWVRDDTPPLKYDVSDHDPS